MSEKIDDIEFTFNKLRYRLLVRKRLEVHPRLASLVRFALERLGFCVTFDSIIHYDANGCSFGVGIRYQACDADGDIDGEDIRWERYV